MRVYIGRLAAVIVATFVTWLAGSFGIQVTEQAHGALVEGVTLIGLGLWGIVYALVHRFASRLINPGDSARGDIIALREDQVYWGEGEPPAVGK